MCRDDDAMNIYSTDTWICNSCVKSVDISVKFIHVHGVSRIR
jgi:hypothetical protein